MSSIPYDPSLVLGQVIPTEKMADLKKLAKLVEPLDLALDRLNNVLSTNYRLKNVAYELENMGIDDKELVEFRANLDKLEGSVVRAALNYGVTATKVYTDVEKEMNKQAQKTISFSIESPLNYSKSKVAQFPLSFDSLDFDVQYHHNEVNDQTSNAHGGQDNTSSSSSGNKKDKHIPSWMFNTGNTRKESNDMHYNTADSLIKQYENHTIKGTVVISAKATHKNADMISPLKIDPLKAIEAWNYTYPEESIDTQPENLMKAALGDFDVKNEKKKTLDIISGSTKASSFVGYVHLLKDETTDNTQSVSSLVDQVKQSFHKDIWIKSSSGGFGNSSSFSNTSKTLTSSSFIQNHANLVCLGLIPSIVVSEISTTCKKMAPDAQKIMEQQSAIAGASQAGGDTENSTEGEADGGKKGAQFKALNSEYMKNTVSNLSEYQTKGNKIIDINSMMTAFEDFVSKSQEGKGGVPTNFYIKSLSKNDIAKIYIRKFFPRGMISAKDKMEGSMGIAAEDTEDE